MKRLFPVAAFCLAALVLVVGSTSPAQAEAGAAPAGNAPDPATEPLPVKVERNVLYATLDGQKLYLDLAMPKEGGPYPVVVMFHGGAWRGGSRKDLSVGDKGKDGKTGVSLMERVAERGYVVASVGYRLAPKYKFPAQMRDARAAVRFLRAHAKEYNLDKDRFAAVGFSAGGHIALLLGLAGDMKEWDAGDNTGESARVQSVVSFFGPTDLSLYAASPALEDAYMVPVFGKEVKTDPEVYKKASPITYVSKTAPPILMVHGTFDLIVPVIHSEKLLKKLKEAGASAELITVRGEGHGWTGPPMLRSLEDSIKFLDAHLKGTGNK